MTWKERYDILVEEIANQPSGTFDIYDPGERPSVFDKIEYVEGDITFNGRLPDNSKEEDYKEYCEFLCDYVGKDLSYYFADIETPTTNKVYKSIKDFVDDVEIEEEK